MLILRLLSCNFFFPYRNSDFDFKYHLTQDPSGSAPQMLDSTSNDYDLTSSGTMTTGDLVDAQIYKGIDFDGVDDSLRDTDAPDLIAAGTPFTISIWANNTAFTQAFPGIIAIGHGGGTSSYSVFLNTNNASYHGVGFGSDTTFAARHTTTNRNAYILPGK